jgi:uncharacterized DUF497 family protein
MVMVHLLFAGNEETLPHKFTVRNWMRYAITGNNFGQNKVNERIRIISAWKANQLQRKRYEQQF